MKKDELLKKCVEVMAMPNVLQWYEKNLTGKPQVETLDTLNIAVQRGELSIYEALCITLIVGFQWNVKFEGTP